MNTWPSRAQSVRPSPVFAAVVAVCALGGLIAWLAADVVRPLAYVGVFVFVIAGWLVSLSLHEFGHAFTAWRFGDHNAATRGYLTLNPLRYTHPMLSLGVPMLFVALGGIGLPGGAVFVQTGFMSPTRRSIVALAGPAANLGLAVSLLWATRMFFDPGHAVFWAGVAFLGLMQLTALTLNLLPVPGLDGYGALEPHLTARSQQALEPIKPWGLVALLVLLISPVLNGWFFAIVFWVFELSGVPGYLAGAGMALTRFWSAWF